MNKRNTARRALFIKSGTSIKRVLSSEILYLHCEGNVTHLHMKDGSEISCVRLLKFFEEDLAGSGFLRINHNAVINFGEVQEIRCVNTRKRQVVLTGDVVLEISYRKWKGVKEALLEQK